MMVCAHKYLITTLISYQCMCVLSVKKVESQIDLLFCINFLKSQKEETGEWKSVQTPWL